MISDYIERWSITPFSHAALPWLLTAAADDRISDAIAGLGDDYQIHGAMAVHQSARIEPGAILKNATIIGPGCLVAAGAYLRGGVFLEEACVVGPGCEVKSSFILRGTRIAHFNFVGDSVLGSDIKIEAGAVIANYRNELDDKAIRIATAAGVIETGVEKFGALVGDGARIGANAVIAPGALIDKGARIERLALIDQRPRP
jgi:NDP-sugar pyrophosphorylase family protein